MPTNTTHVDQAPSILEHAPASGDFSCRGALLFTERTHAGFASVVVKHCQIFQFLTLKPALAEEAQSQKGTRALFDLAHHALEKRKQGQAVGCTREQNLASDRESRACLAKSLKKAPNSPDISSSLSISMISDISVF